MSNYLIRDIELKEPYENSDHIEFLPLREYLKIARKQIKKFAPAWAPAYRVKEILTGEDFAAEVGHFIMIGDLKFDPTRGKTRYSWRNQCAIYGIQEVLGLKGNKKNKELQSLNIELFNNEHSPLRFTYKDNLAEEADEIIGRNDRQERVKKYIKYLLETTPLTPVQEKVIKLRYFSGIRSFKKIGEQFSPTVSRQNVKQILNRALFKLRMSAIGSK